MMVILIGTASTSAYANSANYDINQDVVFYEHHNRGGWRHVPGAWQGNFTGRYNDSISSVSVPPWTAVTVFDNHNHWGRFVELHNNSSHPRLFNLSTQPSSRFNDMGSSFIRRTAVINDETLNGQTVNIRTELQGQRGLDASHRGIIIYDAHNANNQRWVLQLDRASNSYTIRNLRYNTFLSETGTNTISLVNSVNNNNARWRFIPTAVTGVYEIINLATGRALDVFQSQNHNGNRVGTFSRNPQTNQLWRLNVSRYWPNTNYMLDANGQPLEFGVWYHMRMTNRNMPTGWVMSRHHGTDWVNGATGGATGTRFMLRSPSGRTGRVSLGEDFLMFSDVRTNYNAGYLGIERFAGTQFNRMSLRHRNAAHVFNAFVRPNNRNRVTMSVDGRAVSASRAVQHSNLYIGHDSHASAIEFEFRRVAGQ